MIMENSICKIHKENNIIHVRFNRDAFLMHSNLSTVYEYIESVYGKKDLIKLIDVRVPLSIDEKAKRLIVDQHSSGKIARQAILAGKHTNEEIIRVFIEMESKETPLRIFTGYENAIDWLTSDVRTNKLS